MYFTYEQAYVNVDTGLLEAPEHIRAAFQDRAMRYVVEALLLDNNTPEGVYKDLLGWDSMDIATYKRYFFTIPPNLPRLYLYKFIESCPRVTDGDLVRYDLLLGVYDYGWEYIDTTYNRGNRVSVQSRAVYSLKKMFGQIDRLVADCMHNPSTNNMQNLLRLLKSSIELDVNSNASQPVEQLKLSFVEEIQNEGAKHVIDTKKIMGMDFDELNNVRPVVKNSPVQTTLEDIYKDLPKDGQDPSAEPEEETETVDAEIVESETESKN